MCVRECHDDPGVFPDPGAFDPGRFAARAYGRTEYCPFGDGPVERAGNRHWSHWRPSLRFRVALQLREARPG